MSIDPASLLEKLDQGLSLMPLIATDDGLFPGVEPLPPSAFAAARLPGEARAGWLLYAGFGTASHGVAQDLATPEGSYWHAIYHRMEPDAWNSKYWFRQVGSHPTSGQLLEQAKQAGWNPGRNWDHAKFVDFIGEAIVSGKPERVTLASRIQQFEWRLLFDFCVKDLPQ